MDMHNENNFLLYDGRVLISQRFVCSRKLTEVTLCSIRESLTFSVLVSLLND